MSMGSSPHRLAWVHIGDLHVTREALQSVRDLSAIVEDINTHFAGQVEFCLLPGDNANNGTPEQYRLIREAIEPLRVPLHILPGDHDREPGDLAAFHSVLGADRLPKVVTASGYRCLFLDIVSSGTGGPDFRLGAAQLAWLERELKIGRAAGARSLVFMHAYPADLKKDSEALLILLREYGVRVVDMGHTHYNELANDGHTIYAATRSTGQIDEGPVGFSVLSMDEGIVSWRFKPLEAPYPFVMITSPADHRLVTDIGDSAQVVSGRFEVRARAWSGKGGLRCRCRIADGPWQPMNPAVDAGRWVLACGAPVRSFDLTVEAVDATGNCHSHSIRVAGSDFKAPTPLEAGSDASSVGAWEEEHLLGTQLGPNRNGRDW